ncbi:adenosylmethionine--8-amino-7-oxononanoate transaminase [Parvibium lacunae]|uniref:Adenosylmethionine-8-amino-7-oxononanoate aminotransferase n=1 Tax=Parvibium lacunae TaxID=1888893 RepID=A0A368L727_9BURK|nr:adenosylmethionine--8-amino-7-oxononanoate transaminase [Parvibium lacunae]RCS59311.1 adenosylmethionine--8-amino-7-oxononanoate transaminase [Parvibium lacunae]
MTRLKTAIPKSELLAQDHQHCWHPFTQAQTAAPPIPMVRGEREFLFDADGKRYFDGVSSWWVNLHGHAHPVIAEAIAQQARTLEQVMFAGITHAPAVQLAQALVQRAPAPLQHVFYTDNGSTAVEVALKMAAQYWRNQGQLRQRFLAFEGAYHGDTFGAMAAGRSSGFYTPFEDWLFAVDSLPYPHTWQGHGPSADEAESLAWLDQYLLEHGSELVAFIAEPLVQGAAGMRMVRPAYLRAVVERVQAQGIPVIFDEVMTGFGRTGTFFASEQVGVAPDLLCLSKGLTGGFLPMGATLAQPHIYQAFLSDDVGKALLHGHSYTANPLGCAAALASLQLFEEEQTLARIQAQAAVHTEQLARLAQHPRVQRVRQSGTIAAFDLQVNEQNQYGAGAGTWLRERAAQQGVLLRPLGNCIYFIAPYCTANETLIQAYQVVSTLLDELAERQGESRIASDFF